MIAVQINEPENNEVVIKVHFDGNHNYKENRDDVSKMIYDFSSENNLGVDFVDVDTLEFPNMSVFLPFTVKFKDPSYAPLFYQRATHKDSKKLRVKMMKKLNYRQHYKDYGKDI